jgi:hypothetical protein
MSEILQTTQKFNHNLVYVLLPSIAILEGESRIRGFSMMLYPFLSYGSQPKMTNSIMYDNCRSPACYPAIPPSR